MNIFKGFLAIIAGIVAGSLINAGIILLSGIIVGTPEGMNLFDAETVKAHADKLTTGNYFGTLLAHQLGTIAGAFVAAKIAPVRKMIFSVAIGIWFLLGGIYACTLIPAPIWFIIADVALYFPAALFGGKSAGRISNVAVDNIQKAY
jgi:hypothetical protein